MAAVRRSETEPRGRTRSAAADGRPPTRARPLRIPDVVAHAIASTRAARGIDPDELADRARVPSERLIDLETGSVHAKPIEAITDIQRVASCLDLPARSLVDTTVAAWAEAYSTGTGGTPDPLAPTGTVDASDPTAPLAIRPIEPTRPTSAVDGALLTRPDDTLPHEPEGGEQVACPGVTQAPRAGEASGPAVGPSPSAPVSGGARSNRALVWGVRGLVAVNAVAVALLAAASLGAFSSSPVPGRSGAVATAGQHQPAPAVTLVGTGNASASYRVAGEPFQVTVTSDRASWVQMGAPGGTPSFAGFVEPGSPRSFTVHAPLSLLVGAGGTTVKVSAGKTVSTLNPPQAPFTYDLTPA